MQRNHPWFTSQLVLYSLYGWQTKSFMCSAEYKDIWLHRTSCQASCHLQQQRMFSKRRSRWPEKSRLPPETPPPQNISWRSCRKKVKEIGSKNETVASNLVRFLHVSFFLPIPLSLWGNRVNDFWGRKKQAQEAFSLWNLQGLLG